MATSGTDPKTWRLMEQVVERENLKEAMRRVKGTIREITGRTRGRAMEEIIRQLNRYLNGWVEYFQITEAPGILNDLDRWIRRKLRCYKLRQWKNSGRTWFRELRRLGLSAYNARGAASSGKGWWLLSGSRPITAALPNAYFAEQGLLSLFPRHQQLQLFRTAGCGPARPLV